MDGVEMYTYIRDSSEDHLRLSDVKNMKINDTIDVVIWDRNFEEHWIWDEAISEKLYDAETFFAYNRHQLTYLGNMTWTINYPWGGKIDHPIHLDVSSLETYWKWCLIDETDGYIHITYEIVKKGEKIPENWKPKHIHWTDFADTTRVGWRGPIMLWSKLANAPKIYYKKDFFYND